MLQTFQTTNANGKRKKSLELRCSRCRYSRWLRLILQLPPLVLLVPLLVFLPERLRIPVLLLQLPQYLPLRLRPP